MALFALLLSGISAVASDPAFLSLPDSSVVLQRPEGWTIKNREGEVGLHSPDQPSKGPPSRIHLARIKNGATTLEAAVEIEIDRITERAPAWGSSNDRRSYKGSHPVTTRSGLRGLRADFYYDEPTGRRYTIVKYYFFDEHGSIFRVCAHIGGGDQRFKAFEDAILDGLASRRDPSPKTDR